MTRLLAHLLTLWVGACIGFAVGIEVINPDITRYTFTYGPSSMTADLLRSN